MIKSSWIIVGSIIVIFAMTASFFLLKILPKWLENTQTLNPRIQQVLQPSQNKNQSFPIAPSPNIIQPPSSFDGADVVYKDGVFSPLSLTIPAGSDNSCIIKVVNQSDAILRIRLSPQNKDGSEPGFFYNDISPHDTSLIDPRYHQSMEKFHDHFNLSAEFTVVSKSPCL